MTATERVSIASLRSQRSPGSAFPISTIPGYPQVIEPISELSDGHPRYRPFTWKEFIQARVDDNFSDLGSEDTQASHFRIQ